MDEGIIRIFGNRDFKKLHNHIIGRKVYKYDTVSSTNDMAFIYGVKGEKEGAVIWARSQTKGRGRLGRAWISHKDKGLYFSLLLRPEIPVENASTITLVAAVAITNFLRKFSGMEFLIKWPNDIVIKDKKICGILTEMDAEVSKIKFMVIGIGINTNLRQSELPVQESTSLKILLQKELPHDTLLNACLKEIDAYYSLFKSNGYKAIIEEARHLSGLWGRQVKVSQLNTNEIIEGIAADFDDSGALVLRLHNGFLKHINCGDVKLLR